MESVKLAPKKQGENMGNNIQAEKSAENGIKRFGNSEKSFKLISVGKCPKCGKTHIRPHPSTHAVCRCENPLILVALEPAVVLSRRKHIKLKFLAELAGVSEDYVLDVLLHHSMMEVYDKGILNLAKEKEKHE